MDFYRETGEGYMERYIARLIGRIFTISKTSRETGDIQCNMEVCCIVGYKDIFHSYVGTI